MPATPLRDSGIRYLGEVPWGTHFCHFFETKDDLLETVLPFFTAGLEAKEFSCGVVEEPLTEEEAGRPGEPFLTGPFRPREASSSRGPVSGIRAPAPSISEVITPGQEAGEAITGLRRMRVTAAAGLREEAWPPYQRPKKR